MAEETGSHKLVWQPDALPGEEYIPGKQTAFLVATEDYAEMDGGKGSGKSEVLLMDCLRDEKLGNPRWHGVIFRREYKRLTEVIDRATYWFGELPDFKAHWQGQYSRFIFPSGAWLAFHNCELLGDEQKYHGWQITDLKFDELTEFHEQQFNFLVMQNRTGDPKLRPTVRWTCNPLGVGRNWIYERFIRDKEPEKRYSTSVVMPDGSLHELTYRRIFSTVKDNPALKNDKTYIAKLAALPPDMRKAYLDGDWNVVLGQFFYEFTPKHHVVKTVELPGEWRRVGGLDWGNTKVLNVLCQDYEGNIFLEHEFWTGPREGEPSGDSASVFAEQSAVYMLNHDLEGFIVQGDINLWWATGRDIGSDMTPAVIVQQKWNDLFRAEKKRPPLLVQASKKGVETNRYRAACNVAVKDYLHYEEDEEGDLIVKPRLFIFDRCKKFIETFTQLVGDPNKPTDFKSDEDNDHWFDALKMSFMDFWKPGKKLFAVEPEIKAPYDWRVDW